MTLLASAVATSNDANLALENQLKLYKIDSNNIIKIYFLYSS